jgi:hypothetical protein
MKLRSQKLIQKRGPGRFEIEFGLWTELKLASWRSRIFIETNSEQQQLDKAT